MNAGGAAGMQGRAELSGRRNHPVGRGEAVIARTVLDRALRAVPPSLGNAAVLDDLGSIPTPEEAAETRAEPIALRTSHDESVLGGVDIRIHVAVVPTSSAHGVVALTADFSRRDHDGAVARTLDLGASARSATSGR
jgi:hypothetical protein